MRKCGRSCARFACTGCVLFSGGGIAPPSVTFRVQVSVVCCFSKTVEGWDSSTLPAPGQIPEAADTVAALSEAGFGVYILIAFVFMVHCGIGLAVEGSTDIGSKPVYEAYYFEVAYALMSSKFEQAALPERTGEVKSDEYEKVEARRTALRVEHGDDIIEQPPKFFGGIPEERLWDEDDDALPETVAYNARANKTVRKRKSSSVGGGAGSKRAAETGDADDDDDD